MAMASDERAVCGGRERGGGVDGGRGGTSEGGRCGKRLNRRMAESGKNNLRRALAEPQHRT